MPDDNQEDHDVDEEGLDIDQYQDELNKKTNDGGGCAETWEQLEEMRDGSQAGTTRRSVLSLIGATGAGLAGITTTAAETPSQHEAANISIETLLSSQQAEQILSALHPSPEQQAEPNPKGPVKVYPKRAESEIVKTPEETQVVSTSIPSNLGQFTFLSVDGDLSDAVIFRFADLSEGKRKWIDTGTVGWPDGPDASLIGTSDEAVFTRQLTESENSQVLSAVDGSDGRGAAFVNSRREGYSYVTEGTQTRYIFDPEFSVVETESFSPESSIQASCRNRIINCTASLLFPLPTGCALCGYACVAPVPGVGQAACIVCLLATCGAVILAISACSRIWQCV